MRLKPRVLVDVEPVSTGTHLWGTDWGAPFGIAPMGMCNLAWPGCDAAFADIAASVPLPLCVSTASSTPLEDMLRATNGRAWFQLYVTGSQEDALSLADRAATAGYGTLVLTVDVPRLGRRPRDVRNGFRTPFRMGASHFVDFATHPAWSLRTLAAGVPKMANFSGGPKAGGYDRNAARTGANWSFLATVRERWKGRLVVKGVLDAEDAGRIRQAGADAVYVSNHGGRQLDAAPATIEALPAIRSAVGPEFPVFVDGGVRSGEDIVKAVASGADFVFVGRPFLFAMASAGNDGVAMLSEILQQEIAIAMAQLGSSRIADLDATVLG